MMNKLFFVIICLCNCYTFAENCGEYAIEYIPFSAQFDGVIDEKIFEKNVVCRFDMTSCEIDRIFSEKPTPSREFSKSLRVKISKKPSGSFRLITDHSEILDGGQEIQLEKSFKISILKEIKDKGDRCAAEKKYTSLCIARSGQSNRLKDLCRSLKDGILPSNSKKEIVK